MLVFGSNEEIAAFLRDVRLAEQAERESQR